MMNEPAQLKKYIMSKIIYLTWNSYLKLLYMSWNYRKIINASLQNLKRVGRINIQELDKKLMATVRYGFIQWYTIYILQYNRHIYLSPFTKCLEGFVHHQRVHFRWCFVHTALGHGYFFPCVVPDEYGGCSEIAHYQQLKRSVTTTTVWLLALSWRMVGFCTGAVVFAWALIKGGAAGTCNNMQRIPTALEVQRGVLPNQCHTSQWTSLSQHIV